MNRSRINAPFYQGGPRRKGYGPLNDNGEEARYVASGSAIFYDVVYWLSFAASVTALVLGAIAVARTNNGFTTHSLKVTGTLDTSSATVITAPELIIVGEAQAGVTSWPSTNSAKKRTPFVHPRLMSTLPLVPTVLESFTIPSNVYTAPTINGAMDIVKGKVIQNTTILVHPGTYNEDIVLGGFDSDCEGGTAQADTAGERRRPCHGLSLIGDTRRVAGWSFTKGGYHQRNLIMPQLGPSFSIIDLVCVSPTSVRVDLTTTPFSQNSGGSLDFNELLLVAGDIITLYDVGTDTFADKTVISVAGNVINFAEAGCAVDDEDGDSLTIQPNRVIQCQGVDTEQQATFDLHSCLRITNAVNVFGFRVKEAVSPKMHNFAVFQTGRSGALQSVVIDVRTNPSVDEAYFSQQTRGSVVHPTPDQASFTPMNSTNTLSGNIVTVLGNSGGRFNSHGTDDIWEQLWIFGPTCRIQYHATLRVSGITIVRNSGTCLDLDRSSSMHADTLSVMGCGTSSAVFVDDEGMLQMSFNTMRIIKGGSGNCVSLSDRARFFYASQSTSSAASPLFKDCSTGFRVLDGSDARIDVIPTLSGVGTTLVQDASATTYIADVLQVPSFEHTTSGALRTDYREQNLVPSPAAVLAKTLSDAQLADMRNKVYNVYSDTANAHTITLTGSATWDGTNQVATFGGAVGDGLSFRVSTSDTISVTANVNVVFS